MIRKMSHRNRDAAITLIGVLLGGVLSAGGGVAGAYWQAYLSRNQMNEERRLDAIRTFVTACQRLTSLNERSDDALNLLLEISDAKAAKRVDVNTEEFVTAKALSIFDETENALVQWRVEINVINGLFGTTLPEDERKRMDIFFGPLPYDAATRKYMSDHIAKSRAINAETTQRCESDTKMLISMLENSGR
jgi:hypothetical protein